jgi:SCF-associated factor 1
MARLTDLPYDILFQIYDYLVVKDFLALSSTSRVFHDNKDDSGYWKSQALKTFRLPNRPALSAEESFLWPKLYRRLLLQTRIYQWGQGQPGYRTDSDGTDSVRVVGPLRILNAKAPTDWGIIVDLQCGGWSTCFLNHHGRLFIRGVLNQDLEVNLGERTTRELRFHEGSPRKSAPSTPVQDEAYSITQFSTGRRHILAISDDHSIWSWYSSQRPPVRVELPDTDNARPSRVVAGWNKSSVYVRGHGIICWEPLDGRVSGTVEISMSSEPPSWVVPGTQYIRSKGQRAGRSNTQSKDDEGEGEVVSHVVLENFVVFVTDTGRVFATRMDSELSFPVPQLSLQSDKDMSPLAIDVQGSFRKFAIFKSNGEVVVADQTFLDQIERQNPHQTEDIDTPELIPALQNSGVISVAFGDYHFHALHSNGRITSYGSDPGHTPALGLQTHEGLSTSLLRGVYCQDMWNDCLLLPHGYITGRKIWFHPEQYSWYNHVLKRMTETEVDPGRAFWGELSEWVEQQAEDWEKRPGIDPGIDDGLGPYFALSVAAGGWRSGALVLVNDQLVEAITASCKTANGIDIWEEDSTLQTTIEEVQRSLSSDQQAPQLSTWKKTSPRFNLRDGNLSQSVFGVPGWKRVEE